MDAADTRRVAEAQVLAAWKRRAENPLVGYGLIVDKRRRLRTRGWQRLIFRYLPWVIAAGLFALLQRIGSLSMSSWYTPPPPLIDYVWQPVFLTLALLLLCYGLPRMLYWIYALPGKVARFIMGQRGGKDWLAFDESLALSHLSAVEVLVAAIRLYFVPLFISTAVTNIGYWLLTLGMPSQIDNMVFGVIPWETIDYDNYGYIMLFTPLVMLVQVVSAALGTLFYGLWIAALSRGLKAPVVHGGSGLFYLLVYLPYLYLSLFIFSAMTAHGVEGYRSEDAAAYIMWALLVNITILLLAFMLMRLARRWQFVSRLAVGVWPVVFLSFVGFIFLADSWMADWFEFFILGTVHGLCALTLLNPMIIPAIAVDPEAWGEFITIPLSGFRLPFALLLQLAASSLALQFALQSIRIRRREFTE